MAKEVILIVDMLRGFLEEGYPLYCGSWSRKIIPSVIKLLEEKKAAKRIYLCDNHAPDDPEFKMFPPHCVRGSQESQIVPELTPYPGRVIPKTTLSGFYLTDLERVLKELSPEKVTVVGVCTNICVLYAVADLRVRGYTVEVPRDCVATFDQEAHPFALSQIEKVFGVRVIESKPEVQKSKDLKVA